MKICFLRALCLLLCLCTLLCLIPSVRADTVTEESTQAEDISGNGLVTSQKGFWYTSMLFDKKTIHAFDASKGSFLTLEYAQGFGSIYIIFDLEPGAYTLTNNDTGDVYTAGEQGFLHDFLDLEAIFGSHPSSVTISFPNGRARLLEIYVFTPGQAPDFVQKWEQPKEAQTDMILFSTHGDDEQLFFGGLLPYYAQERGYEVLVVYLTNHRAETNVRCHEMLNGLWAVGVRTYPVFGTFHDKKCASADAAFQMHATYGESKEQLLRFVLRQLRRYKPMVAVGHDPNNGEYGHGQHMMYANLLMEAVEISGDPEKYPDIAEQYGVWDVPKTYLHLWPENPIVMDWDQPLESFGGRTGYEVSRYLGFAAHESQHRAFMSWYYGGTQKAADIKESWSPMYYGLYRSTVGLDTGKADFFENVMSHQEAEQARLEAAAAEAEAKRLAEEEARRKAEEEAAAAASRAAEEEARRSSIAAEEALADARKTKTWQIGLVLSLAALAAMAAAASYLKRRAAALPQEVPAPDNCADIPQETQPEESPAQPQEDTGEDSGKE